MFCRPSIIKYKQQTKTSLLSSKRYLLKYFKHVRKKSYAENGLKSSRSVVQSDPGFKHKQDARQALTQATDFCSLQAPCTEATERSLKKVQNVQKQINVVMYSCTNRGCQNLKLFTKYMIELNVHLLACGGAYYRSVRLPRVVNQLRTCRARFCLPKFRKPCVLNKVSVVYFKGKLYFSRCTRFC